MRASVIIASHNDGFFLDRTVDSCTAALAGLDHEIIVADDASVDGSAARAARRAPNIRLIKHAGTLGAPATRHHGAEAARGDVLVFLEGRVKPEAHALARLVWDVEASSGESLVTPRLVPLDAVHWRNIATPSIHGRALDLMTLESRMLSVSELHVSLTGRRQTLSSPAVGGSALAISRTAYEALQGFDVHMRDVGVADMDLSLKAWLAGYSIEHDPHAMIGNAARPADAYVEPVEQTVADRLRQAFKNFSPSVWNEWAAAARGRYEGVTTDGGAGRWARAWSLFMARKDSASDERRHLVARRRHDELWYARRLGLAWPVLATYAGVRGAAHAGPSPKPSQAPSAGPGPAPSPAPVGWGKWFLFGGPGGNAC